MVSGVSENEKRYLGNFENTTGHDITHIYIEILYYDEDDRPYLARSFEPEDTWKNRTKKSLEFSIPDSDKQFKYFKVFISDKSLTFKFSIFYFLFYGRVDNTVSTKF